MPIIELKNVSKGFGEGLDKVNILNNISLDVEDGEFVAIVGFSGSGKSTLINLMSGLDFPDTGEVLFDGKPRGLRRLTPFCSAPRHRSSPSRWRRTRSHGSASSRRPEAQPTSGWWM